MKLNKLFILALASLFAVTACVDKDDPVNGQASLKIEGETSYELDNTLQSLEIKFTANRDWTATVDSKSVAWLSVDPAKGEGSNQTQSISVTVKSNDSYARNGSILISIGSTDRTIKISQRGQEGVEKPDGSKENPFDVVTAIEKCQETGQTETAETYYIKGIISSIKEVDTGTYGNASFYISNDGGTTTFYVFHCNYLGGEKFTSADQIKEGDEVIVCSKLVNYMGNTPETGKGAYIYSLNGEVKEKPGADGPTGEAKGTGTEADPFNPSAAIAKAIETGQTATAEEYYIKGTVSSFKEAINTQFGNATFYISEDGSTTGDQFLIFRIKNVGGVGFTSADQLKVGDVVVVKAKIVNYYGNTPETAGASLISINGEGGNGGGEITPSDPVGDGTEANPFNAAAAKAKAEALAADAPTEEEFYIKGKISGRLEVSTQYKNATFDISDSGKTDETQFYIFRIKNFNNTDFEDPNALKLGDEVVVKAKLVNYKGNTPETSQGGVLISVNGGQEQAPYLTISATSKSVAAEAGEFTFDVKSNQSWTVSATDFLTVTPDAGENAGTVTVSYTANTGVARTATVTVKAADGKEATLTVNQLAEGEEETNDYETTVTYTLGNKCVEEKATINGIADIKVLKFGTSSSTGDCTINIPAGATKLCFWGVAWNKKTGSLIATLNGESQGTINLVSNAGANNNQPYTITVADSDYYTIVFKSPVTEATTLKLESSGSAGNGRALIWGVKAK